MSVTSLFLAHNTTLVAIITLALGVWIYFEKRRDPRHVALGTMLVAVAAWSFTLVLWRNGGSGEERAFWLRTMFFAGSLIPLLFLIFSFSLQRSRSTALWLQVLAAAPQAVLFGLAFFTTSLVSLGRNGEPVLGYGRMVFAAHFSLLLVLAFGVLYSAARADAPAASTPATPGTRMLFVLTGALIAFNSIFGILFGADFTKVPDYLLIANVGLVIGMVFMASSVLEKRFLVEVKLLGPQLFTLLTLFVIIFNIVVTETTIDMTLRVVMLGILSCYAGLTARTMLQQVQRAKQVEDLSERTLKMNAELMKADRLKSRFVSLTSHQLRAPVSGVRMYLDMLKNGDFGPITAKQAGVIDTNALALSRLSETIDTFLDAAKIQLGSLELYKAEVPSGMLIKRTLDELRPLAQKKGLALTAELPGEPPTVVCDEGKILHVLINLVDNAIKYTKTGVVTVSVAVDGGRAAFAVRDTGIGLSADEQAHVTEVFQRGMEAVRLDTGGSGLGLYIVKNILDAHGAGVEVSSPGRDKGTTVSFSLPLA